MTEFKELAAKVPVVVSSGFESLALLENITIYETEEKLLRELDTNRLTTVDEPIVILGRETTVNKRFPVVTLDESLSPGMFSHVLFSKYDVMKKLIRVQSSIPDVIESFAHKDVVIFLVVDGLSYDDAKGVRPVEPCLVDGPTLTREAFLNVVGQPTIGQRLFRRGFVDLRGYSHWTREKDKALTDNIFVPFNAGQLKRVHSFSEAYNDIKQLSMYKTYIQITLMGLDQYSHTNFDEPLIEPYVQRLFDRVDSLVELIESRGRSGVVIMTSDHGILWVRDHALQVVHDPGYTQSDGIRYLNGKILRDYLLPVHFGNRSFSLAKYPYILRNYAINEWGVHGGISYQESLVPLYIREV